MNSLNQEVRKNHGKLKPDNNKPPTLPELELAKKWLEMYVLDGGKLELKYLKEDVDRIKAGTKWSTIYRPL